MKLSVSLLLLAPLAGCNAAAPDEPVQQVAPIDVAAETPGQPEERTVASHAGTYRVRWRPTGGAIPMGEPFDLALWVLDADGVALRADVDLAVDAGMPHHRHGMNVVPELLRREDGGFEARGMLFHMPGAWTMTFDVTDGPLTERAEVVVEVE